MDPPSVGAPTRVRCSLLVLLFPLEPPMSPFSFFPLVSLFVHLRSPHGVVSCRPPFPFLPPHFYLRFSHHSHSLGISIQPIYRNPFILSGFQFTSFLPLRATFF